MFKLTIAKFKTVSEPFCVRRGIPSQQTNPDRTGLAQAGARLLIAWEMV